MCRRIVGDLRVPCIGGAVVHSALKAFAVKIKYLFWRMRGNGSGKYSPQGTPCIISLSPRGKLFDLNVWVCEKKRRRQVIPD